MTSISIASPLGPLTISAKAGRLLSLRFGIVNHTEFETDDMDAPYEPILDKACEQIQEYFEGRRERFNLPLALAGSDLQLKIWSVLYQIPYGRAYSNRDIATLVDSTADAQAVKDAKAANPLPIIIPCHRVVAADGSLGGFLGGAQAKRALLQHEQSYASVFASRAAG